MMPVLLTLGSFKIYTYGTLIALGVWLAVRGMRQRAHGIAALRGDQIYDMVFTVLAAGFLGARIFYVAQHADWYLARPLEVLAFWQGGLVFYGGYPLGVAALFVYYRFQKIPAAEGFDFLVPYVALVQGFGRIGCFLNGCCYGGACGLPWAVTFPESGGPVHPAQLYEAFFDFALYYLLLRLAARRKFPWAVTLAYFFLYAAGRFLIEFIRTDNPGWLLTWNQWISLAVAAIAAGFYFLFNRKRPRFS